MGGKTGSLRAAIYTRVSTAHQAEHGVSVDEQERRCRAHCEAAGWTVVDVFCDAGVSGSKESRPALDRMLDRVDDLDVVVVSGLDRLGRSTKHLLGLYDRFEKSDVMFVSLRESLDSTTSVGRLLRNVLSMLAEFERDLAVERTTTAMAVVGRRGDWPGGPVLFGCRLRDASDGGFPVEKDPETAHIVDLCFEMALAGKSEAIQLELSTRGYKTTVARKDHRPRPFDTNRVAQLLTNPRYAGIVIHRGERVPGVLGRWPTYVAPDDFDRFIASRRDRANVTKRRPGRPPLGYLLAEPATCAECGGALHADTSRRLRDDGTYARRYRCRAAREHHRDSAERCGAKPIDAVAVDQLVLTGIDDLLADAAALRDQLLAGKRAERERLMREVERARDDAETASRARELADRHYADALRERNETKANAVLRGMDRLEADRDRAGKLMNAALDALNSASDELDPDADQLMLAIWHALSGRVRDADGDVRKLNAALRECFERFVVGRDENGALSVLPRLSEAAIERILRDPASWPHGVTARLAGRDGRVIDGTEDSITVEVPVSGEKKTLLMPRGDLSRYAVLGVHEPPEMRGERKLADGSTNTIARRSWTIRSISPARVRWLRAIRAKPSRS